MYLLHLQTQKHKQASQLLLSHIIASIKDANINECAMLQKYDGLQHFTITFTLATINLGTIH